MTYYNKPRSLIRLTVVSIQFSDHVSLLCVPQPHTYYASKEKQSAVLPAFPDIKVLTLPESISKDKGGGWVVVHVCVCVFEALGCHTMIL